MPRSRSTAVTVIIRVVLALLLVPVLLVLLYRFVPVPMTPLMVIRMAEGEGLRRSRVGLDAISPNLRRAVIAAEDARFCIHHGFDWQAIDEAWQEDEEGERRRGGSTISQQTAKNLFLWPGGGWPRKIVEAYPTILLEALWPKDRILEAYLNVVEWGHGIYGAEAAARTYFGVSAAALDPAQAALMAAVLPNPRRWSPAVPTAYIRRRAAIIALRMAMAPAGCR